MMNYKIVLSLITLCFSIPLSAIHGDIDEYDTYGLRCAKMKSPADRADCYGVVIKKTNEELENADKNGEKAYKKEEIQQRLEEAKKQKIEDQDEMKKEALQSGS